MKANSYISKKEYKLLLMMAFIASVFAFASLTQKAIESYNESVLEEQRKIANEADGQPNFGIYVLERGSFIPSFCFSTLFLFIALLKTKRFLFSSLLTFVSFAMFSCELYLCWRAILFDKYFSHFSFLEKIRLIEANKFDYLAFTLVSMLLFWQISILFRIFKEIRQIKNVLS